MESDQPLHQPTARPLGFVGSFAVLVIAALLGSSVGAVMAWIAPSDHYSWVGILVAPLWLVAEFIVEAISGAAFALSGASRAMSVMVALGGFYIAWFYLR
jgi:hypothetical protein